MEGEAVSAAEALKAARAAGIELCVEGCDLALEAHVPPPTEILEGLARHKPEILTLLRSGPDGWSGEDWRVFFDERAGIREHDGGQSRQEAERLAVHDCLAQWRALNPPPAGEPENGCAVCGRNGADIVPYLARAGHVWLHPSCWPRFEAARVQEGRAALRAMLPEVFSATHASATETDR